METFIQWPLILRVACLHGVEVVHLITKVNVDMEIMKTLNHPRKLILDREESPKYLQGASIL